MLLHIQQQSDLPAAVLKALLYLVIRVHINALELKYYCWILKIFKSEFYR